MAKQRCAPFPLRNADFWSIPDPVRGTGAHCNLEVAGMTHFGLPFASPLRGALGHRRLPWMPRRVLFLRVRDAFMARIGSRRFGTSRWSCSASDFRAIFVNNKLVTMVKSKLVKFGEPVCPVFFLDHSKEVRLGFRTWKVPWGFLAGLRMPVLQVRVWVRQTEHEARCLLRVQMCRQRWATHCGVFLPVQKINMLACLS